MKITSMVCLIEVCIRSSTARSIFCIEKNQGGLEEEISYLDSVGIKGMHMQNLKRMDTKGRELKYKCYFTHDYNMPFLMSYFNIDPKPLNYTHPNGIKKISRVIYRRM